LAQVAQDFAPKFSNGQQAGRQSSAKMLYFQWFYELCALGIAPAKQFLSEQNI
jgi:hypothetical protein